MWGADQRVYACCATDTVVVALSHDGDWDRDRLRSLRPGSDEHWVPIPDQPVDTISSEPWHLPSLYYIDEVLYVAGGTDENGVVSDALQAYDLSTRA